MAIVVRAPVEGRVVGLPAVPDPVFARALVGPGTAIDPVLRPGTAVAPVGGKVVKLHPHAFVVVDPEGRGVLVYLGIDTVQLRGVGFEVLVAEGGDVAAGQPVVRWDPAAVAAGGRSPVCPLVALDAAADALTGIATAGEVRPGDEIFRWT